MIIIHPNPITSFFLIDYEYQAFVVKPYCMTTPFIIAKSVMPCHAFERSAAKERKEMEITGFIVSYLGRFPLTTD